MKLNIFLLTSIFAAFYLCEAGPLRLQKRAAFYIANETACVVDNIVYSSGDPIPTDDPCEACKCRPPGFACVLKECRVKPGCRAVRHVGQCCPEYVCDAPESTPLKENNPVPSLNLLPGLNDELVIVPEKIPTTPKPVSVTEIATHPPSQSSVATERSTEVPDVKISSEFHTEIPNSVSAENKPTLVTVENSFVEEAKNDASKDGSYDKVENNAENILLNSEIDIKKDGDFETTTLKTPVSSLEIVKDQEVKIASETEAGHNAEAPEKQPESVITITEIPVTEKTVKNSAANNSKSLKLSDDKSIPVNEKSEKDKDITKMPDQVDIKVTEILTQPSTESSSKINSIASTKSEPEPSETAEESQIKPQSSLYSNNDKIKSETGETVTIVVHVKDKTKTSTETNLSTDFSDASESTTNATQENLLNSKDELKSTEPVNDDKTTLVETNSEAFTSATEPDKKELSTVSPLPVEKPKDAETRSEKSDSTSEAPQSSVSNYETTYLKNDEASSTIIVSQDKHVTESTPAEARTEEEEPKKETTVDLKVLETKDEEPKVSLSIQTTTISQIDLRTDKANENQIKYDGTTELSTKEASATEIKAELRDDENKSDDKGEKTSAEKGPETTPEEKVASTEAIQVEIQTEGRSAEIKSIEILSKNIEKTTVVEILEQKDGATAEMTIQDIKTSAQTERPKADSE